MDAPPAMSNIRSFGQWLWRRPLISKGNFRFPVPMVVSRLFLYILVLIIAYKGAKPYVPASQKEVFESVCHNVWVLLGLGLFFCALTTNDYLDKKYPSTKTSFWAQFSPGKRDYKDPIVRLNLFLGILCLIALMVGMLQTLAKP
jgi:hypothetical protein